MRFDLYFSPWVIIWSILYYFKLIKYNPFIMLCLITLFSIIVILCFLLNNVNINTIIFYTIIVALPKFIMLYLIDKKNIIEGFNLSLILFIIYIIYITYHDKTIYHLYYEKTYLGIINKKSITFDFLTFLSKWYYGF
jgi:hypothetical protein